MTGAEALRAALPRLRAAGVADPAVDARRLLAHALGIAPDRLTLHLPDALTPDAVERFETVIARRCRRQPVSQITGQRAFHGHVFAVSGDTLDPRPETELVVEAALERPFTRVLDLGTGTGCILLSCLAAMPAATGLGVDLSPPALAVAKINALALGLAARAHFRPSDWFSGVEGRFDLIVANPPYISAAEMAGLAPEVRDWEPHLALSPGGDGLDAYRAIAAGAPRHLAPGGRLILEIGWRQAADVTALLAARGLAAETRRDLDGRDRVILAGAPSAP